jgi:phosphoglycolate phosphatase-like HAD superfamily hydrolase
MQKPDLGSLTAFLNQFSIIIFDLDGVILDSARLKVNCMRQALTDFDSGVVEAFLNCFTQEFGQSRQHHFKNFYFNFLKENQGFESFYDAYEPRYAHILNQHYTDVDLCAYASTLIPGLNHKKLFIATGTVTEEAEEVLTKKNLGHYFESIYGSPLEKSDIVNQIIHQQDEPRDKFILIGDALHDRNSACANQIPFLFVERHALINREEIRNDSTIPFYMVDCLNPEALVTHS